MPDSGRRSSHRRAAMAMPHKAIATSTARRACAVRLYSSSASPKADRASQGTMIIAIVVAAKTIPTRHSRASRGRSLRVIESGLLMSCSVPRARPVGTGLRGCRSRPFVPSALAARSCWTQGEAL